MKRRTTSRRGELNVLEDGRPVLGTGVADLRDLRIDQDIQVAPSTERRLNVSGRRADTFPAGHTRL